VSYLPCAAEKMSRRTEGMREGLGELKPAAGEAPASVLAVDGAEIAAAVCGSPQSSTTCAQLTMVPRQDFFEPGE
jgi:hypothetical protein